jgi:hypothetical protein
MNMSTMAKALGRRGGQARSARLSATDKRRVAAMGGRARRESLQAARRIAENLRYATAMAELSGRQAAVTKDRTVSQRLPGVYPPRP